MKRAFSLAELLITVAILGIVAAIVFPTFRSHTQQAKEAAAKENLHAMRTAIELNAIDPDFHIKIPLNPFNELKTINEIADGAEFPSEATGNYGWIYQANTKTVKLDWPGLDSSGTTYFDY